MCEDNFKSLLMQSAATFPSILRGHHSHPSFPAHTLRRNCPHSGFDIHRGRNNFAEIASPHADTTKLWSFIAVLHRHTALLQSDSCRTTSSPPDRSPESNHLTLMLRLVGIHGGNQARISDTDKPAGEQQNAFHGREV